MELKDYIELIQPLILKTQEQQKQINQLNERITLLEFVKLKTYEKQENNQEKETKVKNINKQNIQVKNI